MLINGSSNDFKLNSIRELDISHDKNEQYIQLMVFVIPIEKGNMIVCFTRDITPHKKAELVLQESEGKLRAIFDNSLQSFNYINRFKDSSIYAYNVAKQRSKEFFKKEIKINQLILDFYPKKSKGKYSTYYSNALNGKVVTFELKLHNSQGKDFWFEVHLSPTL